MASQAGPSAPRAGQRLALLAALAVPLAACAGAPAPPSLDASTGWISEGRRPTADPEASSEAPAPSEVAAAPTPWERAPELPSYVLATPRARSLHFTGELDAEVRVNSAAAAYPRLGPARSLPSGSILVQAHHRPGAPDATVLFAMVKHPPGYDPDGGDWEYLVLTPAGEATQRGRLPLCKRCHAEAPNDHLFGGPR